MKNKEIVDIQWKEKKEKLYLDISLYLVNKMYAPDDADFCFQIGNRTLASLCVWQRFGPCQEYLQSRIGPNTMSLETLLLENSALSGMHILKKEKQNISNTKKCTYRIFDGVAKHIDKTIEQGKKACFKVPNIFYELLDWRAQNPLAT